MQELRRIREREGLSRSGLATKSGLPPSTVTRIEAGERSPTVATLEKLAAALDVEMQEFFPKAQADLWSSLSPEQRPNYESLTQQGLRLIRNAFYGRRKPDYAAVAAGVNKACERLEAQLERDDFTPESVREFENVSIGLMRSVEANTSAELFHLTREYGEEPDLRARRSMMAPVEERCGGIRMRTLSLNPDNYEDPETREAIEKLRADFAQWDSAGIAVREEIGK